MADSATIGAGFSDYQGNAGLAGGNFGALIIDTKPFADLAAYTFSRNKFMYIENQKKAEEQAKLIADVSAYDLNSSIPEDRDKIQKGYDELHKFLSDNPTALDYQKNRKGFMKLQKMKSEFANDLAGGKVRDTMYLARQKEINEETNVQEKIRRQNDLDEEARGSDLRTPLRHSDSFDIAPVAVTAPPSAIFDVSKKGSNFITTNTLTLPDMGSVISQAKSLSLGLATDIVDVTSKEFLSKPIAEQNLIKRQQQAQSNSKRLEPAESARELTEVLANPKYQSGVFVNADGTPNIDEIIKDNAGNSIVSGALTTIKQYNDKMREYRTYIREGYFQDSLGKDLNFGMANLRESDYADITLKDGITTEEMLKPRILGMAAPVKRETEIKQTNELFDQQSLAAANYRARLNNQPSEEFKKLPPLLQQPALIFKQHVENIKGFYSRNEGKKGDMIVKAGAIDEITKKALGLDVNDKTSTVIYKRDGTAIINPTVTKNGWSGGTPLTIDQQKLNFITTVRGGSKDEIGLESKFLSEAETGFQYLLGATSGTDIWNSYRQENEAQPQSRTGKDGKVYTSTDGLTWTAEDGTTVKLKK